MTAPDHLRKGCCPGALRPMRSGDGLLLRIRPRAGVLSVPALSVIAHTANTFGSGDIELTNRGNVQMRGLSEDTHPGAIACLDGAGLIDRDVGIESVRNVTVDPLSGIAPSHADIRPLAEELERLLASNALLQRLPGKFGFSFSGDANPWLGGRTTDIMLAATSSGRVSISLDGDDGVEALLRYEEAIDAITKLAAAFLRLTEGDADNPRMAKAVARHGVEAIFAAAGIATSIRAKRPEQGKGSVVGRLQHRDRIFAVGVGFSFGRSNATAVQELSDVAMRLGINVVRISAERAIVFPVARDDDASELLRTAARFGFVVDADDPRLRLDVCSGAPGCANATTRTGTDAAGLIEGLGAALDLYSSIHVSGCEKGCAHRGAAALTLIARDGRYNVVFDGTPDGAASLCAIEPAGLAGAIGRAREGRR